MTEWSAGYISDIGYTYGYYSELNPLRIKLAFLSHGLVFPEVGTACELGFGQGLSANFHAAASVAQWHGTDFNPSQAGFAQELAAISGAGARLYDDAFADFARRPDLPDFDYIGLHGIWSWISDENRSVIVDFIKRKLKVGGVLYISYNTLPGWATFAPMRHLMTEHVEVLGTEGRGIISRIDGALDFAEKLLATNPLFSVANPQIGDRLNKMKEHNRHYLAHEYFNRDWHPMHFASMANWLEPAKLQYACSANYLDYVDVINLKPEQQSFLAEIPDAMFRESVRDFMINQQFRRDYWVKGSRKVTPIEQGEQLRSLRFILTTPRQDVSLKLNGALGEVNLNEPVYAPILDALVDHKPRTLAQIEKLVQAANISVPQLLQAITLLSGAGHLSFAQDDDVVRKAKPYTDKLNLKLMHRAQANPDCLYLVSPVTGGGVQIGRFQQLFLLALLQGKKQPADIAQYVWQILASQGQKLFKEGLVLDAAEDNLAELVKQAEVFMQKQLPIARALQIA